MNNEKEFKDLPEGWKWARLEEVILYEQPQKYIVLAENYEDKSGIPVLTAGKTFILGFTNENFGICNNLPVILFDDFTTDSRFVNFPFKVKSSAAKLLRARDKNINLFYIFNAMQLIKLKPGSEHKRFWISEYSRLSIPLPPLPEQQKIAEILETIDNAIEKTDKIIEKYKRIKQGLMQDLLTKGIDENGNIRNEKTHKFKDSPLGRIPEEWEVSYVSNFIEINPITKINPKELYPFIEMEATPIMGKQYKYITLRRGIEAGSKFKKGDILLARITPSAENGKALLVPDNIEIGIGSTEFIVFRAKENIDSNFLFYLLISDYVRSIAIGLMEGTSGRQRIPKYVFEKVIKVGIPKSKSEQQRIAEILSQIDKTIEKEEQYKEKLKRLKQGLMEDLLTGKVRVNHLVEEEE